MGVLRKRDLPAVLKEKLDRIREGRVVTMSYSEYEQLAPHLDDDVASIPNPRRLGVLDALRVGRITTPEIHAWRQLNGIALSTTHQI